MRVIPPNPTESFLRTVFTGMLATHPDGLIEIAHGWPDRKGPDDPGGPNKAELFPLDQIDKAAHRVGVLNREGQNVYASPSLRKPETRRNHRASKADFYATSWLLAEFDEKAKEGLARLRAKGIEPRLIVVTGTKPERRLHAWVRLAKPADSVGDADRATRILVELSGADPAAKDAGRVMRCAGTVSYPKRSKCEKGYVAEGTSYEEYPDAPAYNIEDIFALEPPKPKREAPARHVARPYVGSDDDAAERDYIIHALAQIPADERGMWFRVGGALYDKFGESGRAIWDDWSSRAGNYEERPGDQEATWRSFGRPYSGQRAWFCRKLLLRDRPGLCWLGAGRAE